ISGWLKNWLASTMSGPSPRSSQAMFTPSGRGNRFTAGCFLDERPCPTGEMIDAELLKLGRGLVEQSVRVGLLGVGEQVAQQQVADRLVERASETRPKFARLGHLAPALVGVEGGRGERLERGSLADRVMEALRQMSCLLRGLTALLSFA